jgi:hypothetical protein
MLLLLFQLTPSNSHTSPMCGLWRIILSVTSWLPLPMITPLAFGREIDRVNRSHILIDTTLARTSQRRWASRKTTKMTTSHRCRVLEAEATPTPGDLQEIQEEVACQTLEGLIPLRFQVSTTAGEVDDKAAHLNLKGCTTIQEMTLDQIEGEEGSIDHLEADSSRCIARANSSPRMAVVLESQVAGHPGSITTDESGLFLIKATSQREIDFYDTLAPALHSAFVGCWTPRFFGTLSLHGRVETGKGSVLKPEQLSQLQTQEGQTVRPSASFCARLNL